MFQAIEAQDPSHQCIEYWKHKELISSISSSRASDDIKLAECSLISPLGDVKAKVFGTNLTKLDQYNNQRFGANQHSFKEMKLILEGLLKKASPDELSTMHRLLGSDDAESSQGRVALAGLIEEIQKSL